MTELKPAFAFLLALVSMTALGPVFAFFWSFCLGAGGAAQSFDKGAVVVCAKQCGLQALLCQKLLNCVCMCLLPCVDTWGFLLTRALHSQPFEPIKRSSNEAIQFDLSIQRGRGCGNAEPCLSCLEALWCVRAACSTNASCIPGRRTTMAAAVVENQIFGVVKVVGDGSCLFHALAFHDQSEGEALKMEILDHMETILAPNDDDFAVEWVMEASHLRDHPDQWGGHMALVAYSHMRERRVLLHQRCPEGDTKAGFSGRAPGQ